MTKQTTNDTQMHQDEGAEEQQDQSFDGPYTGDPAGLGEMSLDEALERLSAAEISMASHQSDVLRLHADMQICGAALSRMWKKPTNMVRSVWFLSYCPSWTILSVLCR